MKRNLGMYAACLLACLPLCGTAAGKGQEKKKEKTEKREKLTADGPYIFRRPDGSARIVSVDAAGRISDSVCAALPEDFAFRVVSHDGKHSFPVTLHPVGRPAWQRTQPEKLFVLSDPHGDLDCVVSLLQGNGIISSACRWQYGANRVVVIGDVFDRGKDAVQILWLLYQLEREAEEAGGSLDFLLGNHEPMVLMNDLRYTKKKYKLLADTLRLRYADLFGPDTELGRWLCTRNTMLTVGRNLFVHAGLSRAFYEKGLDIPAVNSLMSRGLYKRKKEREALSPLVAFLFGSDGPIWYRGMVRHKEKYRPLPPDTLRLLLRKYRADRVFVGHTVFKDISLFYGGKVVAVNVDNAANRKKKRGRAVLIEGKRLYVAGDGGVLRKLKKKH